MPAAEAGEAATAVAAAAREAGEATAAVPAAVTAAVAGRSAESGTTQAGDRQRDRHRDGGDRRRRSPPSRCRSRCRSPAWVVP
ncbi:hypothetical protein, partial [Mycobacterium avium]